MRSFSFFSYIGFYFDVLTVTYLKQWININVSIIELQCRIVFLKHCIMNDVIPPHLNHYAYNKPYVLHYRSIKKLESLTKRYQTTLLKLELRDTYRNIISLRNKLARTTRNILGLLPSHYWNFFVYTQSTHRVSLSITYGRKNQ